MLDYINAENFTFTVDIGTQSPYQTGYGDSVYNLTFSGVVRLPQLLRIPIAN
jgi:hypothetical protein